MFVDNALRDVAGAYNLKRLFVFRSAVIASELAATGLAVYLLAVELPLLPMLAVIAVYAVSNVILWLRIQNRPSASANEFFLHLVVDVIALAALLYFAGGSSNPFVSLFLLPLVIVAATLPKRYVWAMASVTLGCYTFLMLINVPLTQEMAVHGHASHGTHAGHAAPAGDFSLHVLGMWFSFLLAVGLILFFVVSMAEALRQRDQKLAEAREKNLRDEHMVSLGTLAAGAAHELGTPLATMAVLTKEMEQEYKGQPELVEKIEILRSQVDRCKATLGQISASAGQMKAESGHSEDVRSCLNHCISRWQELHPSTSIHVSLEGDEPVPSIVVDETLNQAVINVLNNAADASPEQIELNAMWSVAELRLEIRDFGEGLTAAALDALGKPFYTTKKDGHGLGFYLASEVVRRLGGEMNISNHPDGGALVNIRLPLQKLKTE
ncbi:two-component system, sensor histidine kinase RegB [Mariprofundus ferrinatatus]|uniref:histidine kinase n=1 Tax=Mariprofundus ferrinatatus TaxID=1921087 RepID=A0A2K8L8Z7_9PROT|nr:ATP-binding protein [Mariprofundus ferrinatatus]ATX82361.1 two-component system, sensor histidine kinase RegB [Mariprofundus ferrinatatus]